MRILILEKEAKLDDRNKEGFRTRLEAFVDLMTERRNKKIQDEKITSKKDIDKLYEHYGNNFYNECYQLIHTK